MEKVDVFRYILKNYIDEIVDDEVLQLLQFFNDEKYKRLKYMKDYGKWLLKERREW